jgi:hypothetical protein
VSRRQTGSWTKANGGGAVEMSVADSRSLSLTSIYNSHAMCADGHVTASCFLCSEDESHVPRPKCKAVKHRELPRGDLPRVDKQCLADHSDSEHCMKAQVHTQISEPSGHLAHSEKNS